MSDTKRKNKRPNHSRTFVGFKADIEDVERMEEIADETGLSFSDHGRMAVKKYCQMHKRQKAMKGE